MPDDNPAVTPQETESPQPASPEGAEVESTESTEAVEAASTDADAAAAPPEPPEPVKPIAPELAELTRRAAIASRIEKRAQEREVEVSRRERELAERESSFASADPLAILQQVAKAKGVEFNTLLRRAIQQHANNGELPPDEQAKVKEEQRDRELAELREWRQKEEQRRAAEAQAQQVAAWQNSVVSSARTSADALPYLADLLSQPGGDREVAERAASVAGAYYRKTGDLPETPELLEFLEAQEKQTIDAHEARLRRLGKISEASASSTGPGNPKTSEQAAGPAKTASKTLTNNGASSRPASQNGREMSERDRIEWAAQLLQ